MTGNDCTVGQLHGQRIAALEIRADKQDQLIEKVRNRLPVWATLAIACLSGLLGYTLG